MEIVASVVSAAAASLDCRPPDQVSRHSVGGRLEVDYPRRERRGGSFLSTVRIALVGNAPYANRGCEAIVRGTIEILQGTFEEIQVVSGSFGNPELVRAQGLAETDERIRHFPLWRANALKRWTIPWFRHQVLKRLGQSGILDYETLEQCFGNVTVALEIGGDNYSLDYGIPHNFLALDRWFFSRGIPVVLWGASVGPFDRLPKFERQMMEHLKRMALILVRESESYNYLEAKGVTKNVEIMPDPAFLMSPLKPEVDYFPASQIREVIGLSLSPLLARYVTNGHLGEWTRQSAALVESILRVFSDRLLMLVPHVIDESSVWGNDLLFLKHVVSLLSPELTDRVVLLPPLSAREYKWLIGQCKVFAGARTHATIAAFSQAIPTVSFAYSIKAVGLNRDLLGTLDYCIMPNELKPGAVVERLTHAMQREAILRETLRNKVAQVAEQALQAGRHLRRVVQDHTPITKRSL